MLDMRSEVLPGTESQTLTSAAHTSGMFPPTAVGTQWGLGTSQGYQDHPGVPEPSQGYQSPPRYTKDWPGTPKTGLVHQRLESGDWP